MAQLDARTVSDEIVAAFKDVARPDRYVPEGSGGVFDHGLVDLRYLAAKTWLEIAGHVKYMARHDLQDFYLITKEYLVYLLPGYLLGVLNHDWESVKRVTQSLLILLGGVGDDWIEERSMYLRNRLTPEQKKVVAHWLQLMLQRHKEHAPELYEEGASGTFHQFVVSSWRHWAE